MIRKASARVGDIASLPPFEARAGSYADPISSSAPRGFDADRANPCEPFHGGRTMELPDIPAMALREGRGSDWIEAAVALSADDAERLGAEFIERTRIQRKTEKPFFIDKLPNNWNYLAFIRLILPNAKIIDARRHPLDCCFSNYRQHFAKGQAFSYDLAHMGQYYADYVRAMAHLMRLHRAMPTASFTTIVGRSGAGNPEALEFRAAV
jgi:hypothetical protein